MWLTFFDILDLEPDLSMWSLALYIYSGYAIKGGGEEIQVDMVHPYLMY